jgi:hypothetical protein
MPELEMLMSHGPESWALEPGGFKMVPATLSRNADLDLINSD